MADYTMADVLQFVEENDVKFIRLAFCDIFGAQKNISIMPSELSNAFENGISLDSTSVVGFEGIGDEDLFLIPNPATLSILPWRPSHGRVVRLFCDIVKSDKTAFEDDSRSILKSVVKKASDMGYSCLIGSECEFYLFERDEKGFPTYTPHDYAGYCDIAPLDKGENVRREICLTLEEMGIIPESSHHERGPGQNEIKFKYDSALIAADNLITFKSVVKTVAARNGLFASFMPKPIDDKSGSGLHVNISLIKDSVNIFRCDTKENKAEAECFIAGVLNRIREITLFLNPLTNSYSRFGTSNAPQNVTWSKKSNSVLARIHLANCEEAKMELRSADPSCNPYLAFSLLLLAGLEGIEKKLTLCEPFETMSDNKGKFEKLPKDLGEAILLASKSSFVKNSIPSSILSKYAKIKNAQWKLYSDSTDKSEIDRNLYFMTI